MVSHWIFIKRCDNISSWTPRGIGSGSVLLYLWGNYEKVYMGICGAQELTKRAGHRSRIKVHVMKN